MKLLLALVGCLLCVAPAASALPLYFGAFDDGYLQFTQKRFEAWMPVSQVMAGDDGPEALSGEVYVKAGKLRRVESSGEWGTGRYSYGRATLTLRTDHGNFTAVIPELAFDLRGDIEEYEDGSWFDFRDIDSETFTLKKARYDAQLADFLGVRRKASGGEWYFYADGFDRGDREMGRRGTLAARIYQFSPTFLVVDSVPVEAAGLSTAAVVPEPSLLGLMGVAAGCLLGLRRRR